MKKQTAVEWLQEQLKKGVDFNPLDKNSYLNNVEKLFQQANAMFQEQIEDAYWEGGQDVPTHGRQCEQYYQKTYGDESTDTN